MIAATVYGICIVLAVITISDIIREWGWIAGIVLGVAVLILIGVNEFSKAVEQKEHD